MRTMPTMWGLTIWETQRAIALSFSLMTLTLFWIEVRTKVSHPNYRIFDTDILIHIEVSINCTIALTPPQSYHFAVNRPALWFFGISTYLLNNWGRGEATRTAFLLQSSLQFELPRSFFLRRYICPHKKSRQRTT